MKLILQRFRRVFQDSFLYLLTDSIENFCNVLEVGYLPSSNVNGIQKDL